MTDEPQPPHTTSVAVWGAPSPVAAASRFTVTVGVKCSAACRLAGHAVVIRDGAARELGRGTLGAEPAGGTRALYAAAVTLTAPSEPGVHAWTAVFSAAAAEPPAAAPTPQPEPTPATPTKPRHETPATPLSEPAATPRHEPASATPDEPPAAARHETAAATWDEPASAPRHEPASAPRHEPTSATRHEPTSATRHEARSAPRHEAAACAFSFRTVEPPEHAVAVTVTVVDRETESPLAKAEVHLGTYRTSTDTDGKARIEAPPGRYDLYVRSPGYVPYTDPVTVSANAALRVAAARVSDADLDDDQVWM